MSNNAFFEGLDPSSSRIDPPGGLDELDFDIFDDFGVDRFSRRTPNGDGPRIDNIAPDAAGQPRGTASHDDISTKFSLFHLNVNNLDAHAHLLDALLSLHNFPDFVAITETHLSKTVDSIKLSKYELVSRRDRQDQSGWGGIALYARCDVHQNIVHLQDSESAEISWHTLHSDVGPLLLGLWYRPPNRGNISAVQCFDQELEGLNNFVGRIIVGDMNVHNEKWLKFSNGESKEGLELEAVCAAHGLTQRVKDPTRGEYLLDLVLTDMGKQVTCGVFPGILDKDHRCVIANVDVTIPISSPSSRECFNFGKAKWHDFKLALRDIDWTTVFSGLEADAAATAVTDLILSTAKRFIPMKVVTDKPFKHPWVDDECCELLRRKHAAIGTDAFPAARDACTAGFLAKQAKFVSKTRAKLQSANAKDWWKLSKELMAKPNGKENIPPLRCGDEWAKDPVAKATLLAETFASKARLPDTATNAFSGIESADTALNGFLRLRVRSVLKILKALDEDSGTGPDLLPALILRRCADELALPITLLSRLCLNSGRWPLCWRRHWIHPLHKRKSKADPRHYRGVHLTPQLAKVVERAIGGLFVPWLGEHGFGEHQYAYSHGKSHRDVLAVNLCSWLLLMEDDHAVGLYCSDVSGAFDRVARDRLCAKLRASGLPHRAVVFLESWLEDRVSCVVVSGAHSSDGVLANSVFQGTVLGSPLWNVFYADARHAVRNLGFVETVFADDFNCWAAFDKDVKEFDVVMRLSACQHQLHEWGSANQVTFDPSKEEFVLIRRFRALGPNFKLLGVTFDPQLLMHTGVRKIASEAGWRLQTLLRPRQYFSTPELMRLYKAHVLSYIESGIPGYFHAAPSVLACVDRVQRRFLRELGLSEEDALIHFRLAPLKARRYMAILGFLHRVSLGQVSGQIAKLFPRGVRSTSAVYIGDRVRGVAARHNKQLVDRVHAYSTEQFKRSIFGMVRCYNALPQDVVDEKSVKSLQRRLQLSLLERARAGYEGWQDVFSDGLRYQSLLRFQAFFRHR